MIPLVDVGQGDGVHLAKFLKRLAGEVRIYDMFETAEEGSGIQIALDWAGEWQRLNIVRWGS